MWLLFVCARGHDPQTHSDLHNDDADPGESSADGSLSEHDLLDLQRFALPRERADAHSDGRRPVTVPRLAGVWVHGRAGGMMRIAASLGDRLGAGSQSGWGWDIMSGLDCVDRKPDRQCKREAMHSKVRHRRICILCAKPQDTHRVLTRNRVRNARLSESRKFLRSRHRASRASRALSSFLGEKTTQFQPFSTPRKIELRPFCKKIGRQKNHARLRLVRQPRTVRRSVRLQEMSCSVSFGGGGGGLAQGLGIGLFAFGGGGGGGCMTPARIAV